MDAAKSLILDLLEWIGPDPRPYAETLDAWRTSCPRLPVWEDANDRGLITRRREAGGGAVVAVSAAGAACLREHRRSASRPAVSRPHPPPQLTANALAAGLSRGFLAAAGIALLALLGALATTRVRRQDLAGAGLAPHEDAARQPATVRQHQDRAALAAAVRPCRHC